MTPFETGATTTPGDLRATAPPPRTFGPQGPTLGISATPTSRTIRSGSSGPRALLAAGSPISPRSSAALHAPPRSPRTRSASTN